MAPMSVQRRGLTSGRRSRSPLSFVASFLRAWGPIAVIILLGVLCFETPYELLHAVGTASIVAGLVGVIVRLREVDEYFGGLARAVLVKDAYVRRFDAQALRS
jgi:hypothetical protein